MKLVGIVGSNATFSYNRLLLQYIQRHFANQFDFEILEIDQVPMFDASQGQDQTDHPAIQKLYKAVSEADGVIIATPEHLYTVPAALKSTIEWLSHKVTPFIDKPVYVIGASYLDQGTSRAQLHLDQILVSPRVNAYVFPGHEFLLGNAKEKFDDKGEIIDPNTVDFLAQCIAKFVRYVKLIQKLDDIPESPIERI
ncbi:NAD(P)H-dependent oxidoreductase [Facklamia sp. 7083-14-GEN3]|nr:NAD(P)H-dependent oxidoreductase [Facklamia sp. 7083-14-GEN3]